MTISLSSNDFRIELPVVVDEECGLCNGSGMYPHASYGPACAGTGRKPKLDKPENDAVYK